MRLENIADIISGVVVNRYSAEEGKEYKVLSLKSIEDNIIYENIYDKIKIARDIDSKFILKKGDILFKLYPPYNVAEVNFESEKTLITSNFAVIRVKNKEINSRYLAYILNKKSFKRSLVKSVEGSNVAVLKLATLKELDVKISPLEKQLKSVEFLDLLLKRRLIELKALELREKYFNEILEDI